MREPRTQHSELSLTAWRNLPKTNLDLFCGFIPTGMVTTLLGPILPVFAAKWLLNDARAGNLFAAQFLGSTVGTILSGYFIAWLGYRRFLTLGFALMACGVAALGMVQWPMALGAVALSGISMGFVIPATNLLVSQRNPLRAVAALNILNAAWSAGALVCPLFVAVAIVPDRPKGLLILAALLFAVAAWMGLGNMTPEIGNLKLESGGRRIGADGIQPSNNASPAKIENRKSKNAVPVHAVVFGVLFFLYVGTENSVSGWAATFVHRLAASAGGARWELAPSVFWLALILGRLAAPAILRRVSEAALAAAGLLMALLGVAGLLVSRTTMPALAAVSLAGLGLSSVFPIIITALTERLDRAASALAGWMFAFGGLGGATLPWLVGRISTVFLSLRAGLVVPLAGAIAMLALLRTVVSRQPSVISGQEEAARDDVKCL